MRTTSSREVYRNPWIRVREDVRRARRRHHRHLRRRREAATSPSSLPAEHDGFWLVEQYRYPLGRRAWEFPQGTWSAGDGGTAEELARAELQEETGLRAAGCATWATSTSRPA